MPAISKDKKKEIRRHIRDYRAIDPLASTENIRQYLYKKGYQTAQGNPLDWAFIDRLVRKVRIEVVKEVDMDKLSHRMSQTKERYRVVAERLTRIAFWTPNMGTTPPTYSEQIRALEALIKLDLAILSAELDVGIFDRALGTLKVKQELPEEEKEKIMTAMRQWGILKPKKRAIKKLISYVKPKNKDDDRIIKKVLG